MFRLSGSGNYTLWMTGNGMTVNNALSNTEVMRGSKA
jgi:hypothetical protein